VLFVILATWILAELVSSVHGHSLASEHRAGHGAVTAPRRAVVVFAQSPEDEQRRKPFHAAPHRNDARRCDQRLHRALFDRTLGAVGKLANADVFLVTTGDLDLAFARASRYVPAERLNISPQTGTSFGARLEQAVEQAFAAGCQQVVVIGDDTPDCDAGVLASAFAALDRGSGEAPAAVVGLATDGGYYLLGLSCFTRAPFLGIPFGQPHVADLTISALGEAGYDVATLPSLADVDDANDLLALAHRLRLFRRPDDKFLLALVLSVMSLAGSTLAPRQPSPICSHPRGIPNGRGPPQHGLSFHSS
jgi:glycosyltransferase A (GT-A) superfamily protein (DUF2064 family)